MSNKTYDILKFMAQIVLPALATLVLGFAEIWGLPYGQEISATIMCFDTFLGAVLMVSTSSYNKGKNESREEK